MSTTAAVPPDATPVGLKEQFDDLEQQHASATLGMWIFLATEILLFAGLFLGYTAYRVVYPEAWKLGSAHTDYWLGTINTFVLLTSSLTMALAVRAAEARDRRGRRAMLGLLLLTMALGALFLGIKGYEWVKEYHERLVPGLGFDYGGFPNGQGRYVALFFLFYFLMTGLHALHLLIGILTLWAMVVLGLFGKVGGGNKTPVELAGLFWHLIDVIWVFLYPLLYLAAVRGGGR